MLLYEVIFDIDGKIGKKSAHKQKINSKGGLFSIMGLKNTHADAFLDIALKSSHRFFIKMQSSYREFPDREHPWTETRCRI